MTKISLTLKNTKHQDSLLKIVETIYKISLTLKNTKHQDSLLKIVETIYKISLTLKNTKHQDSLPLYCNSILRILRSEYFIKNHNELINNIESFCSFGQLKSKLWLIETLREKKLVQLGTVFLCAGWYGLLPFFLLNDKKFFIKQIFNFEKDPLSVKVSEDMNRDFVKNNWRFKASLKDILELDYHQDQFDTLKANGTVQNLLVSPDTIINTSCEHINQFSEWWNRLPTKKLIVLQNNDFFQQEGHINCVSSLENLKKQAPMKTVYEGVLKLDRYRRFMLIGYKNS